jgi:hypothetical protein
VEFHGKLPITADTYLGEKSELLGHVLRYDKDDKAIPLTYCENAEGLRGWQFCAFPEPRPLYNLERLAANPDAIVVAVEGEKCASALQGAFDAAGITDYVAITWPGGAHAVGKANITPLVGRNTVTWPDADSDGFGAMLALARKHEQLQISRDGAIIRDVQIVKPDEAWPVGHDVADLIEGGWDAARLVEYINQKSVGIDEFERHARGRFGDAAREAREKPADAFCGFTNIEAVRARLGRS